MENPLYNGPTRKSSTLPVIAKVIVNTVRSSIRRKSLPLTMDLPLSTRCPKQHLLSEVTDQSSEWQCSLCESTSQGIGGRSCDQCDHRACKRCVDTILVIDKLTTREHVLAPPIDAFALDPLAWLRVCCLYMPHELFEPLLALGIRERVIPSTMVDRVFALCCEFGHPMLVDQMLTGTGTTFSNWRRSSAPSHTGMLDGLLRSVSSPDSHILSILMQHAHRIAHGHYSVLLAACEKGVVSTLDDLVCGPTGFHRLSVGPSCLEAAAGNGHLDMVNHLLAAFPNANPAVHDNKALHVAALGGHNGVVARLLKDPRVDPTSKRSRALVGACSNGHLDVVTTLVSDPRIDPNTNYGDPVGTAAENGHANVVSFLLADSRVDASEDNNYAIGIAAANGHSRVVSLLLADKNVDPAADDNYAMMASAGNNHIHVVELLVQDARADPTVGNGCALRCAARHGNHDLAKKLFKKIPAAQQNQAGGQIASALRVACENGHLPVVKLLLRGHKAGEPDVTAAAVNGHPLVVQHLLGTGAQTPPMSVLEQVCKNGHRKVLKILMPPSTIKSATDLHACLASASTAGRHLVVKYLVQHHEFSPDQLERALLCAVEAGHLRVVRKLLKVNKVLASPILNRGFRAACRLSKSTIAVALLNTNRVDPWEKGEKATPKSGFALSCASHDSRVLQAIVKQAKFPTNQAPGLVFAELLIAAAASGRLSIVKEMLQHSDVSPAVQNNLALILACRNGHRGVVNFLLQHQRVNPAAQGNRPFREACEGGHRAVVDRMLLDPRVDPGASDDAAFRGCCAQGKSAVVHRLLQDERVNPTSKQSACLASAADKGHQVVVHYLLSDRRADPNMSGALRSAATTGQLEIVRLLLQDDRTGVAGTGFRAALQQACSYRQLGVIQEMLRDPRALCELDVLADLTSNLDSAQLVAEYAVLNANLMHKLAWSAAPSKMVQQVKHEVAKSVLPVAQCAMNRQIPEYLFREVASWVTTW